jgi:hypothetical protein
MVEAIPSRAADPPGLVVLVKGDVAELDALRAAWIAAEVVGSPLVGAVLPSPRPGLDMLRIMAGDAVARWLDWRDLVTRVTDGAVRCLIVAAATWRVAARAIWPAVERCSLYIQHRRPATPAQHVLLAVDSAGTNAALARRLAKLPLDPGVRITVGYAAKPSWACSLAGALGYAPEVLVPGWEPTLPWLPVPPGADVACVHATPLWGIRALIHELHPDLVVLGLHTHRLRRPSLAHPTAWVLSRELETDVALCPLDQGAVSEGE